MATNDKWNFVFQDTLFMFFLGTARCFIKWQFSFFESLTEISNMACVQDQ